MPWFRREGESYKTRVRLNVSSAIVFESNENKSCMRVDES